MIWAATYNQTCALPNQEGCQNNNHLQPVGMIKDFVNAQQGRERLTDKFFGYFEDKNLSEQWIFW